jgi:CheY-like chemotaxis protein
MGALHKVLVVDDDPVVGKSFDRVLSDKGYIVITAQNGREALDKLREEEFDVVFTDIKMPGMDGLEVAERVKARRPWTPVVIITGNGTVANEVRANAAGVSSFLHKPLSPEMIEGSALKALSEAMPAAAPVAEPAPVIASPEAEPVQKAGTIRNIALFLIAPFVGLVYAMMLPFIGVGMLLWIAGKELSRKPAGALVMKAAMLVASPFIGLVFILAAPFLGLVTLGCIVVGVKMPAPLAKIAARLAQE